MNLSLTLFLLIGQILGPSNIPNIPIDTKSPILTPILISDELKPVLENANKELEISRLKKENIILQLRLILKVPNDYIFDEQTMSFKMEEKKVEKTVKKIDDPKPNSTQKKK